MYEKILKPIFFRFDPEHVHDFFMFFGQAPSDYPDFAQFLVEKGIESISLNPDTVIPTTIAIAKEEAKMKGRKR